jgi:cytochrome oxidase Cu insertion factor (SCO1/SenC/PrrC family)
VPGMNSGLNVDNPTVVAAFRAALLHQGLIALLIFAVLGLAWVGVRSWRPVAAVRPSAAATAEPAGRQLLRIGFGILWLFDGVLQAQPKMAIGLPSQVIEPLAAASPRWVQQVVNWAGTAWSYHPMQAGASAVWIQVGIGIWMLAAPRGALSRLAGLVSVGWGLVVWAFGEAFGGIFAPGLTWLFGAPGAVLIYAVAGVLIALPERAWHTPSLGRLILAGLGVFLAGMAILQAWPGRGFWQGVSHGQPGTLAGMAQTMASTPQPRFLSGWVAAFAGFDQAHGFAVNLFAVAALAVTGAVFLTGRPRLVRPALIGFVVVCAADWVLVEDLGFLGGLGTDPNSMIPMALLAAGGYLAVARVPVAAGSAVTGVAATRPPGGGLRWWTDVARPAWWRGVARPAALRERVAAASIRSVAAAGAVGVIILGAAPMAAAQASPQADPILAQSITGPAGALDYPAAGFALTDQHGRTVTLAGLRGRAVLLTFLDPVCTTDCPLIGQEFRQAAQLLGPAARQVELVAIVLSPGYRSVAVLQAFDRQEGFQNVPDWLYLTGTLPQLQRVWHDYGVIAQDLPAGAMTLHNDQAYVIDRAGHVREEFSTDPGPGTAATKSSFAVLLADAARHALSTS